MYHVIKFFLSIWFCISYPYLNFSSRPAGQKQRNPIIFFSHSFFYYLFLLIFVQVIHSTSPIRFKLLLLFSSCKMADVKFIVETLNKPPYNKNFTLISFDSLAQEDLLQILSDVLLQVNDQQKFNINTDDFEQTITRILNGLFILRYPPIMDTFSNSFRQHLMNGEKNTIFALLEWLLTNMDLLQRRAYLARFLMKIDIPSEILGDSDFVTLHQQYIQLMEEFKKVHKESVLLKSGNKISISELRSDGVTMEKEKEIVANRIYQIRKKIDHLPNAATMLQSCHNLRLEIDRKKEIAWQIQDEAMNTQQCQQRLYRLTQQLQELQKWSVGLSSQALLKKLEEEIYVTSYIVDQKLPRELSQQKKEKEVYENVVRSSNVTKTSNELLMSKVQTISQEISKLLESKLMNSNSADDKTVLFRQQAAIIARKKDNLVEKFSKLKFELNDIRTKLELRQQKLEETVGENGIILKDNEKFQEYVNKLRTRSAIYKRYRSDLTAVKAEGGVLSRTLDILMAKANQFGIDLENLKNYEVKNEDDLQTKSTDAIMALIIQISSNVATQKAKLAPLIEKVKPMQKKVNELLSLHDEKKRIYDKTSITLNTNLAKLVNDVNSLQEEHSKIMLETTLLASKIHIAGVDLERAKLEFQASVDKNNCAPLIRDKLNMKIAESDKLNRLLKEEQKRVRENEPQFLRQKTSWNVIQTLFELKIKGWQREKEELSSLLHLEKGAETLVLR